MRGRVELGPGRVGAWALLVAVLALPAPAAPAGGPPEVAWSRSPRSVVASLTLGSGEGGVAEARSVRVYGDGRVVARYPAHLKHAGRREILLPRSELQGLLRALAASGLPRFDAHAVRARCRAAEAQSPELFYAPGADWLEIELALESYRGPGDAHPRPLRKRVAWHGLAQDLKRFPEVAELRHLAEARERLAGLLARPDLAGSP